MQSLSAQLETVFDDMAINIRLLPDTSASVVVMNPSHRAGLA